jgi:hypothetical protein
VARFARQSSLMRAPQLIRGVGPTLGQVSAHEEAPGLRLYGQTTTARTTTHIASHGAPGVRAPVARPTRVCPGALGLRRAPLRHARMHAHGDALLRALALQRAQSVVRQITSEGRCPEHVVAPRGNTGLASCLRSRAHGIMHRSLMVHTNGRHHGNATDTSRRGGAAQQADAADEARRSCR